MALAFKNSFQRRTSSRVGDFTCCLLFQQRARNALSGHSIPGTGYPPRVYLNFDGFLPTTATRREHGGRAVIASATSSSYAAGEAAAGEAAAFKLVITEKIRAAGPFMRLAQLGSLIGSLPGAAAAIAVKGSLTAFLSGEPCFEVFEVKPSESAVRLRSKKPAAKLAAVKQPVSKQLPVIKQQPVINREKGEQASQGVSQIAFESAAMETASKTTVTATASLPPRRPRYLELKDQGDAMLHFVAWMSRYAAFGIDCEWASGDQLCLVQLSPALPVSAEGSVSDEAPLLLDVLATSCASDIMTLQRNFLSFILESKAHIKVFHGGKQVS